MFGNRIQGYRNSKRLAVNGMVESLCNEDSTGDQAFLIAIFDVLRQVQ